MKRTLASAAAVLLSALLAALKSRAAAPAHIMILDGESAGAYHRWQVVTPVLKKMLDETGLFRVDVVTAPAQSGELTAFMPQFADHQAVVFNYDAPDERWPAATKRAFERYVQNGGGVVIVHAADNAFPGWKFCDHLATD